MRCRWLRSWSSVPSSSSSFDTWDTTEEQFYIDPESVETGNWDLGLQTGAGLAVRYRHAGLRAGLAWDLRPRDPTHSLVGTVVLALRP